ncbi:cytokinin oxidase [Legionella busanensis]|uniref:Cytokinin oxidase n=1 Tax=Legionella busanensis TaxID=190655 RepID=A0A378JJJ1_9GAMM|nr:FAD-binding protein [Legionella busanensis]STX51237.1 cytokinin oxidase [Legionella busanensis]
MQKGIWEQHHLKYCREKFPTAFFDDLDHLNAFNQDFGKLITADAKAIFMSKDITSMQEFVAFANENNLPMTIRGNGMSQCGQSLASSDGVILNTVGLDSVYQYKEQSIWIDANATWSTLINTSLQHNQIPYITPYNCNLSIGGVLSVGGVGAASFKYGSALSHVKALEVITADGRLLQVNSDSALFHACLGGQGQFGIITKACLKLKPCKEQVRTFLLTYIDEEQWLHDLTLFKQYADYIECFCSPAVQGAKLTPNGRKPFAQWLFALHISIEYTANAPQFSDIPNVNPWKILHTQDEPIKDYLHRHDGRFQLMKLTGQWELPHPWYECFIPKQILFDDFQAFLASLPLHYVPILQIVPFACKKPHGFLILPEGEDVFAMMILNPGIPASLVPSCLDAIDNLDKRFLPQGGKRYLSGYLGREVDKYYWQRHFDKRYDEWVSLKRQFDPQCLFQSMLHNWR